VFSAAGGGDVRANPVAAALSDTIIRYRLPLTAFSDLIEARAFDLYDDPMVSLDALDGYAAKTSSALMVLAALILDEGKAPGIGTLAGHSGIAYAIAGLLAAFGQHAARRQLYMPLDVLERHGVSAEDVFAGQATPELRTALAAIRQHARHHLSEAKALVASAPPAAAPAFLPAALAGAMLDRMDRRGYEPFKPLQFPQWRRQWRLWRAARRPERMFG
jgi:phytoene synthase